MKLWTRLAICAWLAACGGGTVPPGAASAPPPCEDSGDGTGYVQALLHVGCDGALEPGRADWTVSGGAVTLDFPVGAPGPKGAELVTAWPPLSQPPWLGHRIRGITVLSGGSIRVEFGDPAGDPARLFADPRLAGTAALPRDGDVRDAIDANEAEILTRHDASIRYARSLGRTVRLLAFDRLYLVAFAHGAGAGGASALAAGVGNDWVGMGAAGARRLPSLTWDDVTSACESGVADGGGGAAAVAEPGRAGRTAGYAAGHRRTVGYRSGDMAAREIAERLVSAGLREGAPAEAVAELTGSRERMVVRPVPPGSGGWSGTDVAVVVGVRAGPVHPCSLHAEVLRELGGWRGGPGRRDGAVLPIGEAAAFAIDTGPERGT